MMVVKSKLFFEHMSAVPTLPLSEVIHLWALPLESLKPGLAFFEQHLKPLEKQQAARFVKAADRERFILCRGAMRLILGFYLKVTPLSLAFQTNEYGKPELLDANGRPLLQFNLSHSGQQGLLAVTRSSPLGVDVEQLQPCADFLGIAERFFSVEERAMLGALSTNEQMQAFYQLWTCKEAFIKALGKGLSVALNKFSIVLGDNPAVASIAPEISVEKNWQLIVFEPAAGYAGSLAFASEKAWPLEHHTLCLDSLEQLYVAR